MPPSRVTTSPSPTSRRSLRFCLALPRCAMGALPFAVSMNVAKLVMSSATEDTSTPADCTIFTAIFWLISSSCSRVTACIASQNRRWSSEVAGILVNRSAAVVFHQSANPAFEHGATSRFSAASARYVPADAPASERRDPAASSMTAATPRSCRTPQAAATSPKARCRVRSGSTAASRASSSASISAAVPRYRSETSLGLPSAQPISRRYQYGFPLITFLYRLAMTLGHRASGRRKQADTPDYRRPDQPGDRRQAIKIELARKLGLGPHYRPELLPCRRPATTCRSKRKSWR